jgi:cytochrome c553
MKVTTSLSALLLLASLPGLAAAQAPAAAKAAPAPAEGGARPAGPPKPWKDMSAQERGKYMKDVVMPRMRVAFQTFDAEQFKKVGCDTCHGKEGKARKFKMPNPEMYALPTTPAAFAPILEKKPKMVQFMGEVVKPQMAALLGLPELDPKKPEAGGFGCFACHSARKD